MWPKAQPVITKVECRRKRERTLVSRENPCHPGDLLYAQVSVHNGAPWYAYPTCIATVQILRAYLTRDADGNEQWYDGWVFEGRKRIRGGTDGWVVVIFRAPIYLPSGTYDVRATAGNQGRFGGVPLTIDQVTSETKFEIVVVRQ